MLTRLYIDNFRCFVNFAYKPETRQLLLGSNGSGKSSLLSAIRYLKQFVKGDANPFTQSTRTRWQDRKKRYSNWPMERFVFSLSTAVTQPPYL